MEVSKLTERYIEAFRTLDFEKIKSILSILNQIQDSKKEGYISLYEKIDDDLFQFGRSLSNNKLEIFNNKISQWKELQKKSTELKNIVPEKKVIGEDFDSVFSNFYNRHFEIFEKLKDYYFFKLEQSTDFAETELVVLCDEESHKRPELDKLIIKENILNKTKETLDDFVNRIQNNSYSSSPNYIGLLYLTPSLLNVEDLQKLKDRLLNLVKSFNKIYSLKIITDKSGNYQNYKIESFEEDEVTQILNSSNKIFNNSKLTYQEQRIIKQFYGSQPVVIDYKVLKPGASGSGVIEVQGNNTVSSGHKRYVIKISKKVSGIPGKLQEELKNFKEFVEPNQSHGYNADFESNETFEAIKYSYASTDSVSNSTSFFDLINDYINKDIGNIIDIKSYLGNLFSIELIRNWNMPQKVVKDTAALYKSYLMNHSAVIEMIQVIWNKSNDEVVKSDFSKSYKKLLDNSIETNTKICHGDLHTENFFWDNSDIYLIDFGHTGIHHAVVDHTFLEISIRLRHFPNYVSIEEYMEYEKEMLTANSFETNFDLSFIKREKIRHLYELIHQIRVDAKKYCHNSPNPLNEYLISLLVISFRLTQYKDLNPLFSLRLAELFISKINS
jgi:Ternary complex associated domain 9